jgi:hypothetical protein
MKSIFDMTREEVRTAFWDELDKVSRMDVTGKYVVTARTGENDFIIVNKDGVLFGIKSASYVAFEDVKLFDSEAEAFKHYASIKTTASWYGFTLNVVRAESERDLLVRIGRKSLEWVDEVANLMEEKELDKEA